MGAADQASIDQGSWLISSVSLLEPPPPYQLFATHVSPSIQESQHTVLYDHRWVDLFLSHLKEVDAYVETKKKLGSKSNTTRVERAPDGGDPPNPKRKAKAKSKGGKGGSAEADE